ncbi:MAG: hypothetical protein GXP55_08215 [Deltaproteobacteria bacterium]|nr:hypothetical protein [Deltaproteobacteria bacterium]
MDRVKTALARVARVVVLLTFMNLWLGSDCVIPDTGPCWSEHAVQAHLVEVYDAAAQSTYIADRLPADLPPTCGALDGLAAGSRIELDVRTQDIGMDAGACVPSRGTVTNGLRVTADATGLLSEPWSMAAEGELVLADGCRGEWALALVSSTQPIDTPWAASFPPPAVWVRYFRTTTAENCPTLPATSSGTFECADAWAGEVLSR